MTIAFDHLKDLYWSSPRTTFRALPLTVFVLESIRLRRLVLPNRGGVALMCYGFLQYWLVRGYRARLGGGSGGMTGTPEALVTVGPYGIVRNPMYLGHLICALGLVVGFRTPLATALALSRLVYFQLRVNRDEERLERIFGDEYRDYKRRVPRWLPLIRVRGVN